MLCEQQAPHMAGLHQQYGDKGLVMIGINADPDVAMMKKTAAKRNMSWPQVCDGKERNTLMYQEWGGAPSAGVITGR